MPASGSVTKAASPSMCVVQATVRSSREAMVWMLAMRGSILRVCSAASNERERYVSLAMQCNVSAPAHCDSRQGPSQRWHLWLQFNTPMRAWLGVPIRTFHRDLLVLLLYQQHPGRNDISAHMERSTRSSYSRVLRRLCQSSAVCNLLYADAQASALRQSSGMQQYHFKSRQCIIMYNVEMLRQHMSH